MAYFKITQNKKVNFRQLARENVNIAHQNLKNAEKLCEVAESKRSMGKISENDLLQLQLNVLNARSSLTASA